jgi:hypothetical protein
MDAEPPQLQNIRQAFHTVTYRVNVALRTQRGDPQHLRAEIDEVLFLLETAEQVYLEGFLLCTTLTGYSQCHGNIPDEEFELLELSANNMIHALEEAAAAGHQEPVYQPPVVISPVTTGNRGRPSISIDPAFLEMAVTSRGPTDLAHLLGCSARTVRRRLLLLGLSQPGEPLFKLVQHEDGSAAIAHNPTPQKPTTLTDEELDQVIAQILETFPEFGQQMIAGHLEYQGHLVTRERVRQSYYRVHGPPSNFGRRVIVRRVYKVAGPNALWHHDGQHGKISPLEFQF